MTDFPYDSAQEKDYLSTAIGAVHHHWGTRHMAKAYEALVQAIAHAEQA